MSFDCKPKGNVSGSLTRPLTRSVTSTAFSRVPITDEQTEMRKDACQNRASPAMHAQTAALAAPGTCTNPKTVPGTIRDQGDPLNNLISGTSQLFLFLQIYTCRASMDGGEKWEPSMPPHSCMIEHIHREFQAQTTLQPATFRGKQ